VWPTNVTDDFLNECKKKKEHVQQFPEVHLNVWKNISTALEQKGHVIAWDLCRAKFHQLNDFFVNSALKCGGIFGNQKWSYYDRFLEIHDIPHDAEVPKDVEFENDQNNNNDDGKNALLTTLQTYYFI